MKIQPNCFTNGRFCLRTVKWLFNTSGFASIVGMTEGFVYNGRFIGWLILIDLYLAF